MDDTHSYWVTRLLASVILWFDFLWLARSPLNQSIAAGKQNPGISPVESEAGGVRDRAETTRRFYPTMI